MAADLSSLKYKQDDNGEALLVSKEGWQVMMEWEKPYMEACVSVLGLGPESSVLEIGFGMGYSSNKIQSFGVKSHTIIECSPDVLHKLHRWIEGYSVTTGLGLESDQQRNDGKLNQPKGPRRENVHVVEGVWQLTLPELGKFDAIFMDDYPIESETFKDEMQKRFPKYADAYFQAPSKWEAFVDICLNWHLNPGGRIGGYMVVPKYPKRDDCTAYMFPYDVKVSKVCKYVTNNQPVGFAAHRRPTAAQPKIEGEESELPTRKVGSDHSSSVMRTMVIPKITLTPTKSSEEETGSPRKRRSVFRSHSFQHVVVSNADKAIAAFLKRKAQRKQQPKPERQSQDPPKKAVS